MASARAASQSGTGLFPGGVLDILAVQRQRSDARSPGEGLRVDKRAEQAVGDQRLGARGMRQRHSRPLDGFCTSSLSTHRALDWGLAPPLSLHSGLGVSHPSFSLNIRPPRLGSAPPLSLTQSSGLGFYINNNLTHYVAAFPPVICTAIVSDATREQALFPLRYAALS
uniref:Uncharacterized protein n=1 Tax=Knipowitschia caucasica TaxID=637954 RepID=A0AAV2JM69_KNICA